MKGYFFILASRSRLLALAVLAYMAPAPALAQDVPQVISPLRVEMDHNGVNLLTGKTQMPMPVLAVPGAPNLRYDRAQNAAPYVVGTIQSTGAGSYPEASYSVHTGAGTSEAFKCIDFDCASVTGTGSTFTPNINNYRQAGSGALYRFTKLHVDTGGTNRSVLYYVSTVIYPNGEEITYNYDTVEALDRVWHRPTTITSNLGYFISLSYRSNVFDPYNDSDWSEVSQAAIYASVAPTAPLGRLSYGTNGSITDHGSRPLSDSSGRVYYCQGCSTQIGVNIETAAGSMQLPGESTPSLQVTRRTDYPVVASVVKDGVTWNYSYTNLRYDSYSLAYLYDRLTITGPNGFQQTYDLFAQGPAGGKRNVIDQSTDALARVTDYSFDDAYRPIRVVLPELNEISVDYDDTYGNLISKTTKAKPNTGLANIVETAHVDTINCVTVLCYRPVWIRDGMNRQTDFVYNSLGQLIEQTDPADADGVRRKTYITYETTTTGVSRKNVVRVCGTGAACGTANEIRTEYDYWGNTLLPSVERKIDAARGITLTTTYGYDAAGRLLWVDGPLAGNDDAVYSRYDVYGRKSWEIGPKGANGLRSAKRFTYRDSDDKVIAVEEGTVPDPSSTTLSVLTRVDTTYDSRRNPVREAVSADGVTYSLVQRTFQDIGRLECEAQRMNPAAFGSLPASACLLGAEGNDGPDRITRNVYDAAGQLLQVQKAYGVTTANGFPATLQQNYATYTYTPNGKQKNVTDANGNKAELRYDGHDRQVRWVFPSKTTAGLLNEADYESYTWDNAGNRLSLRKRDGTLITYAYDNLNRATAKNVPASASGAAGYAVYYGYNALNLQTWARFGSTGGQGITNSYDALGRLLTSTTNMSGDVKTLSYLYDAGSRRIRVTHPDGNWFGYSYDAGGAPLTIGANAVSGLVAYSYDSAGRLDSKGSGNYTYYDYDAVGRLSQINEALSGGVGANLATFGYNPASQITSRSYSNDAYASTSAYDVSRSYSVNGLNQYTAAGPATFAYDANGNLTSDGSTSFVYDAENRLVSASGTKNATLSYDPLGRLYQISGAAGTTRFLYDGNELVMEYTVNSADPPLRRYVHGPGVDDPLVWYEGGTLSPSVAKLLKTDWQGSIVALTDWNGYLAKINGYDSWGIPNAGNLGRFQYTGQAWLEELGMYHYKARIYSPTLGRFLQTDPVGYDDQMNLYAYVGNDPVNVVDPSGEDRVVCNVSVKENGEFSGTCTLSADDSEGTSVTYNVTRHYTDAYGNNHTSSQTFTQSFGASITQESLVSSFIFGYGQEIRESVDRTLSAIAGRDVQALTQSKWAASGNGRISGRDSFAAGSGGGLRNLGNLRNRADELARDVARERGGTGRVVNEMGPWANRTLREISKAADSGDRSAQKALKLLKQADRLGQRY